MKKLFYAAFAYLFLGVASGLFYRELTKFTDFPEGQNTQLGLAHSHFLVLGFVILMLILLLERTFGISDRTKMFNWFFGLYNAGLVLTGGMLMVHGSHTVLGKESGAMIAGIAGLGHIFLTAAMVILFLLTKPAIMRAASGSQEGRSNR